MIGRVHRHGVRVFAVGKVDGRSVVVVAVVVDGAGIALVVLVVETELRFPE